MCLHECMYSRVYVYHQQAEEVEIEIEDFTKQNEGTVIKAYALVDLDNEVAYGFKVTNQDKSKNEHVCIWLSLY